MSLPLGEVKFTEALAQVARAGQLMGESRALEAYVTLCSVKYSGSPDVPGAGFIEGMALLELGHVTEARAAFGLECLSHPETIEAANVARSIDAGRTWKSCAIVGDDGHDPCVLYNLMSFYSDLGFRAFATDKPEPADLIVIQRFNENLPLDFSAVPKDTPIHIFEYTGAPLLRLLEITKDRPVSLFVSSEKLLSRKSGVKEQVLLPPVATSLWTRMGPRFIPFAHLGNCQVREAQRSWPLFEELLGALEQSDVFVWGKHWENFPQVRNWVGETEIPGVPDIYGKALFALGLLYPYQLERGVFSSHYWQAPLAGCSLICESSSLTYIPGVYSWGLKDGLERARREKPDPLAVQKEALIFWLQQWDQAKARVSEALREMPPRDTGKLPQSPDAWMSCASFRRLYADD